MLKSTGSRELIAHLRQVAATGRQIDLLLYELYGLTKEEICTVEDAWHEGAG